VEVEMAAWSEIGVTDDVTCALPVASAAGGKQLVTLSRRWLGEREVLVISAPVCDRDACDAPVALERSAKMGIGMLCFEEGILAVRATAFLDVLPIADVRAMADLVAAEAARLACAIPSRPRRVSAFHNYAV
jgi:hypothetical protein